VVVTILALVAAPRALGADTAAIAGHIRILASDAFQGRFPRTIGETKAVAYIVSEFKKVGLSPGGEIVDKRRTWFQNVPVTSSDIVGGVTATLATPQGRTTWVQSQDIAIRSTLLETPHVHVADASFVFIGSSYADPEKNGHDLDDIDLKGKIALFTFNPAPPRYAPKPGAAGLMLQALRAGASGILFIHQAALVGYAWATTANSYVQTRFDVPREDRAPLRIPLEGAISENAAAALFHAAGLDLHTVAKTVGAPTFKPIALTGPTLSVDYDARLAHGVSRTVMGRLVGTTHPKETIIFGAHWDHEGMGAPDAAGDRIYHGALDNASGVAGLIEIARGIAKKPRTERSIVFISWTLEEPGLLGSTYYSEHPVYPLETTVADITMDCLLPIGHAHDFGGWGYEDSTLDRWLIEAGAAQGRRYAPTSHPERGYKYRSDHYPFAKKGVPSVLFLSGADLIDGGREKGEAYFTEFFAHRYHQQSDRFDATWNLDGLADDVRLLVDFGVKLGNTRAWPEWKPISEFKSARESSAAERRE
jgi:Zn-dependent M28 family amino/carboxypeptidase